MAITVILLGAIVSRLDLAALGASLSGAQLDATLILIAVIWAQRYLAAVRWWLLLRCNNPGLPVWSVVRVTFASDFAGQFLPGTVGVEAVRICGMARVTGNTAGAISSILVDRLLSTAALAGLVLVAVAAAPSAMEIEGGIAVVGVVCLGLAAGMGVALMSPRVRRVLARVIPSSLGERLKDRLAMLAASLDQYRCRHGLLALGLILAVVFQLVRVVMYAVGATALGIEAPLAAFAVFVPVVIFLAMLPISIGGFGVREAAFVYLFARVGVAAEDAVALSLFVYAVHMLCRLPGAWFCAFGPAGPRPCAESTSRERGQTPRMVPAVGGDRR